MSEAYIDESLISFSKLFSDKIDKGFLVNLSREKLLLDKKIISIPFVDFIGCHKTYSSL